MASAIDDFNKLSLVIKKAEELEQSVKYNIVEVEVKTLKFGESVLLTLEANGEKFKIFMGKRFHDTLKNLQKDINSGVGKYNLLYLGCNETDDKRYQRFALEAQ